MSFRRQLLTAGFALGLSMFGIKFGYSAENVPSVGQQAPEFTLPSQDGTNVGLDQFRGKWVVLYFYPKDNTPGCTIEAHNFQRDLSKYESNGAVVIGVSVDSADSHKGFCAKQGLTFKLASDTEMKVTDSYGSLSNTFGFKHAARNTFLINPPARLPRSGPASIPANIANKYLQHWTSLKRNRFSRPFCITISHGMDSWRHQQRH